MVSRTIPFTASIFESHPRPKPGQSPIVKRREGVKYQQVTFYANTISLGISKTFKGQRFNEVIGHWPEMSISTFDKIARERVSKIELGYYNKAASLLIGDFFIDYVLPMMESRNRDIESVKTRWRRVAPIFAHQALGDVSKLQITQFLTELSTQVKGSTVNRHLSLLSRIFSLAVELELLVVNPCKGIKKWPENNIRDRVLSDDELRIYIREAIHINSFQSKALLFSLITGLRIGNVIDIRREMLSDDLTLLTLPMTKNGKSYRVMLNEPAREVLKSCAELSWNEWIFPSAVKEGAHIAYPRSCHEKIRDVVLQSTGGSESFNIHDLRRTYASRQLMLTGDARLVQSSLFHQSITTTERYAFHQQSKLAEASQSTALSLLSGNSELRL
ncbi:TPA: site-specific integrase [Vibrio parahaemolyticus]|nr:site-specific integrase [Vibrio parahaemolyticus]